MAPIRLRHPKGVSTLQIPLDKEDYTVGDLQQEIYKATEILPSQQSLKLGYPPQALTLVAELPLSSLGLKPGDQLILQQNSPTSTQPSQSQPRSTTSSAPRPTPDPGLAAPKQQGTNGLTTVWVDGGWLVHRVVPDDNSCLFSSIALIFEQSISKAQEVRKIVAEGIKNDPITYDEAILGMPPSKYIDAILKPNTWGGAIELAILAKHYNTEIASIDVETGRIDNFSPPEGSQFGSRCILIYSGIHYDLASFSPVEDAPDDWHQKRFPIISGGRDKDPILVAAKELADKLRAKRAYTNTATFDLKCQDCGQGLKGEKGARAHAEQTGHVRFGEY